MDLITEAIALEVVASGLSDLVAAWTEAPGQRFSGFEAVVGRGSAWKRVRSGPLTQISAVLSAPEWGVYLLGR
jgi:hypothetical protein